MQQLKVTKIQSISSFSMYGQKRKHKLSFEQLHRQFTFTFLLIPQELNFVLIFSNLFLNVRHLHLYNSLCLADVFSSSKPELAWNLVKKMLGFHHSKKLGVCHADDILYLFK